MNTELLLTSLDKYGAKALDILVQNEIREAYMALGILSALALIAVIVFLVFNKKHKNMMLNPNKYCGIGKDDAASSKVISGIVALMFLFILCIFGPTCIYSIKYPEASVIKHILTHR